MLRRGKMLHGRYEILSLVGRGGMSYVYLSRDRQLNKNWAVKQVRKDGSVEMQYAVNSLMAEAEIMKRLDHPLLPRIVDIFDDDDDLFVVMDYIEGRALSDVIEYGIPPYASSVSWAVQMCDVLTYLHSQDPPIIYRDMKPANIMLSPDGDKVKLLDFGIARELKDTDASDTTALGTVGYAAPEQTGTGARTDRRTDIYNLGMTLYHLLSGINPNDAGFVNRPLRMVNPMIPAGLERIVIRATRPSPDERYQTASEMKEELLRHETLTESYISIQKNKIKHVILPLAIAAVFLISGTALLITDSRQSENIYCSLIAETGSSEARIENISEAVKMKPDDPRGYEALLEEYSQSGFTEEESGRLLTLFNENRDEMDQDSDEYLDLCFEIGEGILMYYEGKSDSSTRNRILKAEPFFSEIIESGNSSYRNFAVSETYVELAYFYREYMLGKGSLIVKEASKEEYEKLLSSAEKLAENLMELSGTDAAYLRVTSLGIAAGILDAKASGIADSGIRESRAERVSQMLQKACEESECTLDSEKEKKKECKDAIDKLIMDIKISYEYERKVRD